MAVKDESLEIQKQEVTEPISDNQEVSTVDNSMPTNDTYTLDNANQKINDMYDAMNKATTEQYEGQLEVAKQEAEQQRPTIEKEYNDNANDLAYQYNINRRNMAMTDRSNGLSTGTFYERQNALSQKYTSTYAQNQTAKADALAQVDVQLAKLESEYRNQISQAITKNDIARAQALYDEWNNGYTRDKAQADTLAQYGDFTGYQKLGYTDEQIQQMVDEYNRQKDIEDLSAKLQKAATLAASGDFSGYLEAGYSEQEVANMRNYWIYSNPMAAYILGMITLDQYNKIINGEYFEMDGAGTGTDLTGGGTGTGSGGTGTGGTGSGSSGSGSGGGSSSGGGSGSGGGSSSGGGGSGSGGSGGGDYSGGGNQTSGDTTTGGDTTTAEEDNNTTQHYNNTPSDLAGAGTGKSESGKTGEELLQELIDEEDKKQAEIERKRDDAIVDTNKPRIDQMTIEELNEYIRIKEGSEGAADQRLLEYAKEVLAGKQNSVYSHDREDKSGKYYDIDHMSDEELYEYVHDREGAENEDLYNYALKLYYENRERIDSAYKEHQQKIDNALAGHTREDEALEIESGKSGIDMMTDKELQGFINKWQTKEYNNVNATLLKYAEEEQKRREQEKANSSASHAREDAKYAEETKQKTIAEGKSVIDKMDYETLQAYVDYMFTHRDDDINIALYEYAIGVLPTLEEEYNANEQMKANSEAGHLREDERLEIESGKSGIDVMTDKELQGFINTYQAKEDNNVNSTLLKYAEAEQAKREQKKEESAAGHSREDAKYEAEEKAKREQQRLEDGKKEIDGMTYNKLAEYLSDPSLINSDNAVDKALLEYATNKAMNEYFSTPPKTQEERKEENKNNDYNNTASDLAGATANSGASESGKTGQELLWDLVMQQAEDMTREQIQQRIDAIGSSGDQTVLNAYKYALETKPASTVVSETPVGNEVNNKVTATGSNLSQDEKNKVQQAVGRTTNTTVTVGTAAQNQAINRSMGVTTAGNKTTNFGSVTSGRTTTTTTKPTSTQNTTYTGPVNTGGTSTNYRSNSASGSRMH